MAAAVVAGWSTIPVHAERKAPGISAAARCLQGIDASPGGAVSMEEAMKTANAAKGRDLPDSDRRPETGRARRSAVQLAMRYVARLGAAVLLAVMVTACAFTDGRRDGWTIKEETFKQIVPGKSTRADIEQLFGKPHRTLVYPFNQQEGWEYPYAGPGIVNTLIVVFESEDPASRVKTSMTQVMYSAGRRR